MLLNKETLEQLRLTRKKDLRVADRILKKLQLEIARLDNPVAAAYVSSHMLAAYLSAWRDPSNPRVVSEEIDELRLRRAKMVVEVAFFLLAEMDQEFAERGLPQ